MGQSDYHDQVGLFLNVNTGVETTIEGHFQQLVNSKLNQSLDLDTALNESGRLIQKMIEDKTLVLTGFDWSTFKIYINDMPIKSSNRDKYAE